MVAISVVDAIKRLRYTDPANPTPAEVAYRQRFLALYPASEADVLSFQRNPKCSCQGRIFRAVQQNLQLLMDSAASLFGDDTTIEASAQ